MTVLSDLALVFGIVSGFANVPQIWKIYRTKSAGDISIATYLILTLGTIVWLLYGIELNSLPIMSMESFALVEFILVLIGCYKYWNKKRRK